MSSTAAEIGAELKALYEQAADLRRKELEKTMPIINRIVALKKQLRKISDLAMFADAKQRPELTLWTIQYLYDEAEDEYDFVIDGDSRAISAGRPPEEPVATFTNAF